MRALTDHVVEGDSANHQLEVVAADEPGAGGANHNYIVNIPGGTGLLIHFQEGPIREDGLNGASHESLLAIIIDRLRSFQAGPFSCRENAIALTHCEDALMWLQKRTRDRIKRGVEGSTKA